MSVLGVDGHEWTRIPVSDGPGGVSVHPDHRNRILVANAGSGTLTVADDLTTGPPAPGTSATIAHPLVGQRLPAFTPPAMRSGLSGPNGTIIYNPLTGNPDGSGRQPFPNNVIPSNLISPIAQKVQSYFPAANVPGIVDTLLCRGRSS